MTASDMGIWLSLKCCLAEVRSVFYDRRLF